MYKREISLFLAVIMVVTMLQADFGYAAARTMEHQTKAANGYDSYTPGGTDPYDASDEEDKDDPYDGADEEEPYDPDSVAVVSNLKAVYQKADESIRLTYDTKNCDYVNIYANNQRLEEDYTENVYDYDTWIEGMTYEFKIEPYNPAGVVGTSAVVSFLAPHKTAVLDFLDVDYDLENGVLIVDWDGDNIASADVYQDDVLIASKVAEKRLLKDIKLPPLSKHTYRVVPYNRFDEAGNEMTFLLDVEDYEARLDESEIIYKPELKQIQMKWKSSFTEYVEIYLNDEIILENYKGDSFVFSYELQPGATYIVSIVPHNYRNEAGEITEEDVSVGDFEVPQEIAATVISVNGKDSTGAFTGFSKPAVNVSWEAQKYAVYEIYRAPKDKQSAYNWIATVTPQKEGTYVYRDEKVGIGTYYYKIRRKIIQDDYIYQELLSALSDSEQIKVKVPKATLKARLSETGQIKLTMGADKEYVSGYDIYRQNSKGKYKKIASVTENEYTDTDIEFGRTYRYKVKAYYYDTGIQKKRMGSYSKVFKVKNTIGEMEAEAVAKSASTVRLSWTPAANATGYEVYYKSGTQGDSYVLWTTTKKLSLTRKLSKNASYSFMIKAFCEGEEGRDYFSSVEVSGKLGFDAPTGFKVSKTYHKKNGNVVIQKDKLTWNRVYGAKGYYIDVYDYAKKKYVRVAKVQNGRKTSYTVSNVLTAVPTTRKYRICAYTDSSMKKGTTLEITPQLGASSKVKAASLGSKVKISWKKVTGAEKYRVYRSNGRSMLLVGETKKTTITDKGLSVGAGFNYYVQAVNDKLKLTGVKSLPVSYTAKQGKISKLTAVNTTSKNVQLAWNAAKNATSYNVYYSTSKDGEYQKIAEVSAKTTSYVHEKQEKGTTCYYKVAAVQENAGGISIESNAVSTKVIITK